MASRSHTRTHMSYTDTIIFSSEPIQFISYMRYTAGQHVQNEANQLNDRQTRPHRHAPQKWEMCSETGR